MCLETFTLGDTYNVRYPKYDALGFRASHEFLLEFGAIESFYTSKTRGTFENGETLTKCLKHCVDLKIEKSYAALRAVGE